MKVILVFFLLAFIGLYVILRFIRRIMNFLGEPERKAPKQNSQIHDGLNTQTAVKKKKVIPHDEGEYVDYKEVK